MSNFELPPIVRVIWNDTRSFHEWYGLEDPAFEEESTPLVTVGFLIEDKGDSLVISTTVDPLEFQCMDPVLIIKSAVVGEVTRLETIDAVLNSGADGGSSASSGDRDSPGV